MGDRQGQVGSGSGLCRGWRGRQPGHGAGACACASVFGECECGIEVGATRWLPRMETTVNCANGWCFWRFEVSLHAKGRWGRACVRSCMCLLASTRALVRLCVRVCVCPRARSNVASARDRAEQCDNVVSSQLIVRDIHLGRGRPGVI